MLEQIIKDRHLEVPQRDGSRNIKKDNSINTLTNTKRARNPRTEK
jgi:hypothetical protein